MQASLCADDHIDRLGENFHLHDIGVGGDRFPVGVRGDRAVQRCDVQFGGFEVADGRMARLSPLDEARDEQKDSKPAELPGDADGEFSVVVFRLGGHEEGAAHPAAVHHRNHQGGLFERAAIVFDAQERGVEIQEDGFQGGDQIGGKARQPGEFGGFKSDDGVEPDPDPVAEVPALREQPAG